MPFSWRALLFTPLVLPLLITVVFFAQSPPPRAAMPFSQHLLFYLLFFGIGTAASYAATWGLLLPGMFLVSRHRTVSVWIAMAVGLAAGGVVYLAHLWVWHKSSGPNSGPPQENFLAFLRMHFDLLSLDAGFIFACGLVTALLYWLAARHLSGAPVA